jgi:hypothetical protein
LRPRRFAHSSSEGNPTDTFLTWEDRRSAADRPRVAGERYFASGFHGGASVQAHQLFITPTSILGQGFISNSLDSNHRRQARSSASLLVS